MDMEKTKQPIVKRKNQKFLLLKNEEKEKKNRNFKYTYTCRVHSFVIPCGLLHLPILPARGMRGTSPCDQHINDFETFKINAISSNDISLNFASLVPTITSSTWRKKYTTNYTWDCANYLISLVLNLVKPNLFEVIIKNKKKNFKNSRIRGMPPILINRNYQYVSLNITNAMVD